MKDEGYVQSGICDTKPAISLKRSGLEPKLLQSVYRNLCTAYRLVTNLETSGDELWPTFWEQNFSTTDISHTFCRSATKFGNVGGLANRNLFPEFGEVWSEGPVIPYGNIHQLLYTLVHYDNFPTCADSFSVLSIHCIAR